VAFRRSRLAPAQPPPPHHPGPANWASSTSGGATVRKSHSSCLGTGLTLRAKVNCSREAFVCISLALLCSLGRCPSLSGCPVLSLPGFAQESAAAPAGKGAIEGVLKDASGRPVAGALVAAVPDVALPAPTEEASRAAGTTHSAPDGHFRIEDLNPGAYALTATAPSLAAAYQAGLKVTAGKMLSGVELVFAKEGFTISGKVRDSAGRPIPAAHVRALSYNIQNTFGYVDADSYGEYSITLPQGKYLMIVVSQGLEAGEEEVTADRDRRLDFALYPPGFGAKETTEWFRSHAIPLDTVEAGHGFKDMQPLKKIVGGAHIVELGEATHGTREFFQFKHRMLEFLVSEMGFTVFGIEAHWPASLAVNDYVLNGKGDPAKALAGMYFWTWNTEEVLDMIRWMRRYNQDPSHVKKVKFYGFDMQTPTLAAKRVVAYLQKVDPGFAPKSEQILAPLTNPFVSHNYRKLDKESKLATSAGVAEILKRFETEKQNYIARSSESEWVLAQHHAQILSQGLANRSPGGSYVRDRAMAENIKWILDHEEPATRMVVWAHNAHVSAEPADPNTDSMGGHLRRMYGKEMVVFGFAFNQGSFQAIEMPFDSGIGLRQFTVGPAPSGSLDATLAGAGLPLFAVDLRAAPDSGPVADWLRRAHLTRSFGAGYDDAHPLFDWIAASRNYDALFFVEKTSAARANPLGGSLEPALVKSSPPTNLDFEQGELGEVPPSWFVSGWSPNAGYRAALSDQQPRSGKRCVLLVRSGERITENYGALIQRLDAAPYHGKRVRLRAAVRAEVSGPGNEARVSLDVSGQQTEFTGPITARDWRDYEVVVDVPPDALSVTLGLNLVGDGRAWFDSVSFEVIGDAASKPVTSK
jgi:erythromycin esterase